ncbi:p48 polypeptide of DNA primase [Coemansia sp. RSA 486]|nr:p48 polypeptide of DNA primase [Coemansia sp. RSA 486]
MLTKERWTKVLAALPDEDLRKSLDAQWSKRPDRSSVDKWSEMIDAVDRKAAKRGSKFGLSTFERDMMLQFVYPRLDENVTTHLNHLLKSPFCIHPKTGRVCTPIAADQFDSYDPMEAPTLAQLLREINATSGQGNGATGVSAMTEYIKIFEEFVASLGPVNDSQGSSIQKQNSLDF